MLHAEKGEGLVCEVTCSVSWWSGVTQLIELNKIRPFLRYPCLLSTINVRFEPSKDRLSLVSQRYVRVSCDLRAVALTSAMTFHPRGGLDLLSPPLSVTWLGVPGFPPFLRATLKTWEWPGDEANHTQSLIVHACIWNGNRTASINSVTASGRGGRELKRHLFYCYCMYSLVDANIHFDNEILMLSSAVVMNANLYFHF